jgi:hypothetical protein
MEIAKKKYEDPPETTPSTDKVESETEPENENTKINPEYASQNLYNLQFATYYMIESSTRAYGYKELDGLTETMESMKEQYLDIFEKLYEQYGDEYLEKVLAPGVMWGALTAQNFLTTYIKNKKKEESES